MLALLSLVPNRNVILNSLDVLISSNFPSPHSELLMGVLFGVSPSRNISRFNDVMLTTSLVHVIVVSGYNISLVFSFIEKLIRTSFKTLNFIAASFLAVIYAWIVGFTPPVLRAIIMLLLLKFVRLLGYNSSGLFVLSLSVFMMLIYDITLLTDVSFQLTCAATLGLILFSELFSSFLARFHLPSVFQEDFAATLSTSLLVMPLLSFHFDRISFLGLISNPLSLWLIPLITMLGFVYIPAVLINAKLGNIVRIGVMTASSLFINFSVFIMNLFDSSF